MGTVQISSCLFPTIKGAASDLVRMKEASHGQQGNFTKQRTVCQQHLHDTGSSILLSSYEEAREMGASPLESPSFFSTMIECIRLPGALRLTLLHC